jgi:alanyl-tRNA synthetase
MSKQKNRFSVDNLVREYLEYFRARGHQVVPSAPLLPEDPTLLFTAAGMVPFKAYYSDPDRAPSPRVASVQKCLRAGGKQSDLENVGRTLRHHTFFEMLGNFSFGDYFKKEAIEYGWELSVDVWGLDRDRIWISVYEEDDEAHELWHRHIGFPEERIVRLGKKDNFWGPVGDTGVCGPSSEMYYDTGAARSCGKPDCRPGCDCDRYIEYWNHVFPQFFYTEAGAYDPLPRPGIDTGLGLERLAFILQGAEDNFHTDELVRIRGAVSSALPAGVSEGDARVALNVATDHVRALTFAIAEGIMPSNEGRGYVLRRLLRRALTKMHPFGVRDPFLAGAVDVVVAAMSGRYPEIRPQATLVKNVVTAEEERFLSTLEQGMDRLQTMFEDAAARKRTVLDGADVFQLYDTFGFPRELTRELAEDHGLSVDHAAYDRAMADQKERARRGATFHAGDGERAGEFVRVGAAAGSEFIGYDRLECDARASGVRAASAGRARDDGNYVEFTTDRTVFYPEGGGQVGDTGSARFGQAVLEVVDTYRVGERIAHLARWTYSGAPADVLRAHPEGALAVDRAARYDTMRNHTATHALHAALRRVLGDHVAQAGSLVEPARLRFDFHHFQATTREEIEEVERIVNDVVMADLRVDATFMAYKDALETGAMALFGEKYGERVRVVSIDGFSKELCGGTHLRSTGEMGAFLVRSEGAVGSGIRRVEALTGRGALSHVRALEDDWKNVARVLKVAPGDVERRVRALLDELEATQKQLRAGEAARAKAQAGAALTRGVDVSGVRYVAARVPAAGVPALRQYGDELRGTLGLGLALLCQDVRDKPVCLVVASDRLIAERSVKATDITDRVARELSYRGGGKPHMAQFGIPNAGEFNKIEEFVRAVLESLL